MNVSTFSIVTIVTLGGSSLKWKLCLFTIENQMILALKWFYKFYRSRVLEFPANFTRMWTFWSTWHAELVYYLLQRYFNLRRIFHSTRYHQQIPRTTEDIFWVLWPLTVVKCRTQCSLSMKYDWVQKYAGRFKIIHQTFCKGNQGRHRTLRNSQMFLIFAISCKKNLRKKLTFLTKSSLIFEFWKKIQSPKFPSSISGYVTLGCYAFNSFNKW